LAHRSCALFMSGRRQYVLCRTAVNNVGPTAAAAVATRVAAHASSLAALPVTRRGPISLFQRELRRCADSKAVLRAGSGTQLPLKLEDLQAFFGRLKEVGRLPKVGTELHHFVEKVKDALPACGAEGANLALTCFADMRCRQGTLVAWPFFIRNLDSLAATHLAQGIWSGSVVPNPPRELIRDVKGVACLVGPRLAELPEDLFYRCIYGLARISRGKNLEDFQRRAEKALVRLLHPSQHCGFRPTQLVHFCWAFSRLGSQPGAVFDALERPLRDIVGHLSDRELEALYGILTSQELVGQWKLIHDVERAMEARQEQWVTGDPNKAPRKTPFRRKWTRPSIMAPLAPRKQTGRS